MENMVSSMELKCHRVDGFYADNAELKKRVQFYEKDYADAVKTSKLLKERNEMLATKVDGLLAYVRWYRETPKD